MPEVNEVVRKIVSKYLESNRRKWRTLADLSEETKVSKVDIYRALTALVKEGTISVKGLGPDRQAIMPEAVESWEVEQVKISKMVPDVKLSAPVACHRRASGLYGVYFGDTNVVDMQGTLIFLFKPDSQIVATAVVAVVSNQTVSVRLVE